MSVQRRAHVGYEVVCDAVPCAATTATAAPAPYRRTPILAISAAIQLLWIETRVDGRPLWVCPIHQTFDHRLGRWVPIPGITQVRVHNRRKTTKEHR